MTATTTRRSNEPTQDPPARHAGWSHDWQSKWSHEPGRKPATPVPCSWQATPCIGLNGGPEFQQSEAFSFQIATDDQAETDRLWNAVVNNGGQESECGWCKDKWGLSWQITPRVLTEAFNSPDRAVAKRAFDAMMTMRKIDVATIEAAVRG